MNAKFLTMAFSSLVFTLCSFINTANAGLITDIIDPTPDAYLTPSSGDYEFTHDINDEFDNALNSILGFTLEIDVYDDNDNDYNRYGYRSGYCHGSRWGGYHCHSGYRYLISSAQYENLNVTIDDVNIGTYEIDYDPLGFSNLDFSNLQATGFLDISLLVTSGDLYFAKSTLTVEYEKVAVPEPSTLAIFGLAIMGLVSRRSKAMKK